MFELLQEHCHFLFRLLVAMAAGGFQALFPGLARSRIIRQRQMGLAQQFPGRRILRIELDAALEMLGGLGVFPKIQVALAQAEAQ